MHIRHVAVISSFVVLLSSQAFGQARVVEAGGGGNVAAQPAGGGNDIVVSLYNQLEALQQEVQTLRGLVEEQGNQIRRMQTEQRDRYLDIDSRLNELGTGAPAVGGVPGAPATTSALPPTSTQPPALQGAGTPVVTAPSATLPAANTDASVSLPNAGAAAPPAQPSVTGIPPQQNPTTTRSNTPSANSTTLVGAASGSPQEEQELYRNALKLLVEENKNEEAIQSFQTYLTTYPRGRLLTNSLYWLGEAYLAVANYPQAEAAFNRLLNDYPQDPKAPDALLKLGMVYKGTGDTERARQIWQELPGRYPESANDIRLAREYLQGL